MFFKIVGGGFTENHFLGVFDFLALMIAHYIAYYLHAYFFFIMLPLEVSEFGVLIGALLLVSIGSTYIQYIYLISVVFQGNCFIILSETYFFCQQREREWYEKTQMTQWRNHEHERISQTKLWETGHTPRSDCSYLPQLNLITPLSNMISSLDLIRLPCLLFLHYASFRSVGVRSINRGIVKVLPLKLHTYNILIW